MSYSSVQITRNIWRLDLGATVIGPQSASFRVWAPERDSVSVRIVAGKACEVPLRKDAQGYFAGIAEGVGAEDRYFYALNQNNYYPGQYSLVLFFLLFLYIFPYDFIISSYGAYTIPLAQMRHLRFSTSLRVRLETQKTPK